MAQPVNPTGLRRFRWLDLAFYVLLAVLLLRWLSPGSSGPEKNTLAKAFSLPVVDAPERRVTLESLRGSPVVIEVLAPWCGACRSMAPRMAELARLPSSRDARILGIAIDTSLADAQAMKSSWQLHFDVVLGNPAFTADYEIKSLPTILVLDAEGRVRHVTTGMTRVSTLEGWLSELGTGAK